MAKNLGFPPSNEKNAYFISYNSEDAGRIRRTATELYRLGLPLWYDNGLKYNEEWHKQIADHIESEPALLMCISLALFKKKNSYVKREYNIASKDFDKPILVILLDDIKREDVPNASKIWWDEVDELQHILLDPAWSGQQCAALILEKLEIDPHTLTPPQDISSLRQPAEEETPGDGTASDPDASERYTSDLASDPAADASAGTASPEGPDASGTSSAEGPDASAGTSSAEEPDASGTSSAEEPDASGTSSAEGSDASGTSAGDASSGRSRRYGGPERKAHTMLGRIIELMSSDLYDDEDYYDDDLPNDDDDPLNDVNDDLYHDLNDDESEEAEDLPLTPGRIIDRMIASFRGMFAQDKEADYKWIASFQRSPDAAAVPDGRLAALIAVLLMVTGINLLYTTAYVSDPSLSYNYLLRHVFILGLGLIAASLLIFIDLRHLKRFFFIFYAVTAVGIVVRYYLESASGIRNWYTMDLLRIGEFTFRLSSMLILAFMLCLFSFINEDAAWIWPLIVTFTTAVLEMIYLRAAIQAFFAILIGLFVLSRYPVPLFRRLFRFLVIFWIAVLVISFIIVKFFPQAAGNIGLRIWTDPYEYINTLSPSYQYLLRVLFHAKLIGDGIMGNMDLLSSTGPGTAPVLSVILDLYGWIGFAAAVLLFAYLSRFLFRCRRYAYDCGYPELSILIGMIFLHFTLNWGISALACCGLLPYMWEAHVPLMNYGSVQFIFLSELGLTAMSLRAIRKNSFAEVMS